MLICHSSLVGWTVNPTRFPSRSWPRRGAAHDERRGGPDERDSGLVLAGGPRNTAFRVHFASEDMRFMGTAGETTATCARLLPPPPPSSCWDKRPPGHAMPPLNTPPRLVVAAGHTTSVAAAIAACDVEMDKHTIPCDRGSALPCMLHLFVLLVACAIACCTFPRALQQLRCAGSRAAAAELTLFVQGLGRLAQQAATTGALAAGATAAMRRQLRSSSRSSKHASEG